MRIVTYKRIKELTQKHADSENPLHFWQHTVTAKNWDNLNDVKQDFNSVDYIGKQYQALIERIEELLQNPDYI